MKRSTGVEFVECCYDIANSLSMARRRVTGRQHRDGFNEDALILRTEYKR